MTASDATQLQRQTLSHQIRESLVRRIVVGELQPGDRLVETRLAAAFGTSQAPVREALRELETFGLVEIRPRRGTFVRSFVQQTLRESYVVRAALEETATRLVLLSGALPEGGLRADIAAMRRAAEVQDAEAMVTASVSFHRRIVEAAGNELLRLSWEALHIQARTSIIIMALGLDLAAIAEDHERLLDSLTAGDTEAACLHARDHQWGYAELPRSGG